MWVHLHTKSHQFGFGHPFIGFHKLPLGLSVGLFGKYLIYFLGAYCGHRRQNPEVLGSEKVGFGMFRVDNAEHFPL